MTVKGLTPIEDAALLAKVKVSLNVTGSQFDESLTLYIDEVKQYLHSAGVLEEVVHSTLAVGCIARGVADLWNYGGTDAKLSEYFYQRAEQLRGIEVEANG